MAVVAAAGTNSCRRPTEPDDSGVPRKLQAYDNHDADRRLNVNVACVDALSADIIVSSYYDPDINDAPEDSTVINLHLQLDTWFNNLPRELLISVRSNSAPLPHVIVLNICYWWTLMHLHRPLYQRGQTSGPTSHDSRLFADLSIKMCDRAAYKIVQLIRTFEQAHGLRYYPRNMFQASGL
ncbi:hypothetical protein FS749_010315 [Ceratobasidium sp. UAMH 11750]|nr:hypothetical protein FS749_010315 [Ceratobasidium sp. UAMH 11750]